MYVYRGGKCVCFKGLVEGFRLSMQQQHARHKYGIWPLLAKCEGVTATLAPLVPTPMRTYMGASTIRSSVIKEVYFVYLGAHQLKYFFVAWSAYFAECTKNKCTF